MSCSETLGTVLCVLYPPFGDQKMAYNCWGPVAQAPNDERVKVVNAATQARNDEIVFRNCLKELFKEIVRKF